MTRHSPPCTTCDNTTVALVSGDLVPCPECKPRWHRCVPQRSIALDSKGRPTSRHERAVGFVCHPADIEIHPGKCKPWKGGKWKVCK